MKGINHTILVGWVSKPPKLTSLPSGRSVARLILATNDHDPEGADRIEWHRLVIFGKAAEIAARYIQKGMYLYVDGSLRTTRWTDTKGCVQHTTEIVVHQFRMFHRQNIRPMDEGGDETDEVNAKDSPHND